MTPETIATHDAPAWRDRADFLIRADLAAFDMPGRWEDLWVHRLPGSQFQLCCIPFFTYGIALGDVVAARAAGADWLLERVISKSGHRTIRVAVEDASRLAELHEALHATVASLPVPHEWHGSGYLAIDVPPEDTASRIADAFTAYRANGRIALEVDE